MRTTISRRMNVDDIHKICFLMQGESNDYRKEELYELSMDEDDRIATNALWTFTHFDIANNEWLFAKHDHLIDRVLIEKNTTKLRLMLGILLRQPFEEGSLRSVFIDFCLSKITTCSCPCAIWSLCIKLAYEQMRFYPEFLAELKAVLDMLEQEALSPGLVSARRHVLKRIKEKSESSTRFGRVAER